MSDELVAWLRAALDEDEAWALGCSVPYEHAPEGSTAPEGGVHWRWVVGDRWETVVPDPVATEYGFVEGPDRDWLVWLATVEEWPSGESGHMMPRTYANSIEEMDAAAAGHIARHDPARVLREVEAKRKLVELHTAAVLPGGQVPEAIYCPTCNGSDWDMYPMPVGCATLRLIAAPYAGREGWREEWGA